MSTAASRCAYTATRTDYEGWGGDADTWTDLLDVLGVDDDVWSCPHEAVDGEDRCVFHLPPAAVPADVDEAQALLDAVAAAGDGCARRTRQFLGATFGQFDLGRATLETAADHPLVFNGATFTRGAAFAGRSAHAFRFEYATFADEVDFTDATFAGGIDCWGATFERDALFWGATFGGGTTFFRATFANGANFRDATFEDGANFVRTTFGERVNFRGSSFGGEARFRFAAFEDGVSFAASATDETTFAVPPDLSDAALVAVDFGAAPLAGADFEATDLTDADLSAADLRGANLERARLSRATLFGTDLRGAALSGAVMTDARIDDGTRFLEPPVDDLPVAALLPRGLGLLPGVRPVVPACGYDPAFVPAADPDESGVDWPAPDVSRAKSVYRTIETLASLGSRPLLQSRAFVRRQDIQRAQYRSAARTGRGRLERAVDRGRWVRASVARWFLLYGESPWRVIGTGVAVVVVAALLYPLGLVRAGTAGPALTYPWPPTVDRTLPVLAESGYVSLVAFAGGLGRYTPLGLGRVVATAEMVAGVVLFALLVFVFGRRASR